MVNGIILISAKLLITVVGVALLGYYLLQFTAIYVDTALEIKESMQRRNVVELVEVGGARYYKDTYGRIHPYE